VSYLIEHGADKDAINRELREPTEVGNDCEVLIDLTPLYEP